MEACRIGHIFKDDASFRSDPSQKMNLNPDLQSQPKMGLDRSPISSLSLFRKS